MQLSYIDWSIILVLFVVYLGVGYYYSKEAGRSTTDFFLSGRNMPWWLLGLSMVATTFAIDTPNLVTGLVREQGVSGNWIWWAFLLTGMLTVFVYSRLWRRSGVQTDLEFYRIRYSGKAGAFLQGFRAVYLGVFFNVMIMANVCLAAIKLGGVVLNLSPLETLLIASIITVIYSSLGGLKSVLMTDALQFGIAMVGSIGAAWVIVRRPEIGGMQALLSHEVVSTKLAIFPEWHSPEVWIPVFLIPLAVQWWSTWYPGAEPGGGGYVAQRMLSAKNERHAMGAVFFFNLAHYALRPWPWILVALASLVIFPGLEDLQLAFPQVDAGILQHDLAYPAMLSLLPAGLLGIVVASLIAAFMSTISTHLNWGSSYVVNDVYRRFLRPEASEKEMVLVGRLCTWALMLLAAMLALYLRSAMQAFQLLLSIGAGTGLIFILRWFWWRINAYTEISGMMVSFGVAVFWELIYPNLGLEMIPPWQRLLFSVLTTTIVWWLVTWFTPGTDAHVLKAFYMKIRPDGPGWKPVKDQLSGQEIREVEAQKSDSIPRGLLGMFCGVVLVYSLLFSVGNLLYGALLPAIFLAGLVMISGYGLWRYFRAGG